MPSRLSASPGLGVAICLASAWLAGSMAANAAPATNAPARLVRIAAAQPKARLIDYQLSNHGELLERVDQSLRELSTLVAKAAAAGSHVIALPEDTLGLGRWEAAHPEALAQVLPRAVERMLQ